MADLNNNLPEKVQQVIGTLQKEGHLTAQIEPFVLDYLLGNPVKVSQIHSEDKNDFKKAAERGLQVLGVGTSLDVFSDHENKTFYIRQDLPEWEEKVASKLPAPAEQQTPAIVYDELPPDLQGYYRMVQRSGEYNQLLEDINSKTGGAVKEFFITFQEMRAADYSEDISGHQISISLQLMSIYNAVRNDPQKLRTLSDLATDLGLREMPEYEDAMKFLPVTPDETQTNTPAVHNAFDEVKPSTQPTSFKF